MRIENITYCNNTVFGLVDGVVKYNRLDNKVVLTEEYLTNIKYFNVIGINNVTYIVTFSNNGILRTDKCSIVNNNLIVLETSESNIEDVAYGILLYHNKTAHEVAITYVTSKG